MLHRELENVLHIYHLPKSCDVFAKTDHLGKKLREALEIGNARSEWYQGAPAMTLPTSLRNVVGLLMGSETVYKTIHPGTIRSRERTPPPKKKTPIKVILIAECALSGGVDGLLRASNLLVNLICCNIMTSYLV